MDRHELGERFALQDGRFKYIWYSEGRDELYRVDEDPYETNDLLDEAPSEGLALGRTLDPLVRDLRRHDEVETVGRSTRDELRALGYLD